ncbi:SpoIIE family protein phosphatase [Streptomyces olivaceus]|uniref:SpoIIE family protein phosphatase n=1 Tax=Streptomyces olivaceus TaxID=47716 RepID=UPI00382288B5
MNEDRLLRLYEALVHAVPQSVWVMSADGVVTTLTRGGAGDRQLWYPSEGGSWMETVHPKDRDWFERVWRRARGKLTTVDVVLRVRLEDDRGRYRHIKVVATPVRDRDGEVEWVGTAADAEDHWREHMREKLLARMAAVPTARNLPEAFLTAAAAVVPDLADAVAVFRVQDTSDTGFSADGGRREVTGRVAIAPGLPPLPSIDEDFWLEETAQQVIESQKPRLLTFPAEGPPDGMVAGASQRWLRQAGATGMALVPVVVADRTVALAAVATCRGNPPPDEGDILLMQDIFHQMSGPLRRTMELESIRNTALALQRSFLATPPDIEGIAISALYHPADSAAEVGGDWYDALRLTDDALALTIGDIAGHDVTAATTMGRINSMLRGFAYDSGPAASPAATLSKLDRTVQALGGPSMITVVHAVLRRGPAHTWQVTLSNAGHPPPLLIPANAPPRYLHSLDAPGPPLCVADNFSRIDLRTVLRDGDTLLLYTDGLVEAPGTDIGHNLRHLRERTEALAQQQQPPATLIRELLPAVHNRLDDIAVIALQARTTP